MRYLSQFDLLQIRTRLQAEVRQTFDLMNPPALHAALAAPRQDVFGEELHTGLPAKAAILFIRLIDNHPFYDGNKRIAVVALRLFLQRNSHALASSDEESLQLARQVATGHAGEPVVQDWIAQRITPL